MADTNHKMNDQQQAYVMHMMSMRTTFYLFYLMGLKAGQQGVELLDCEDIAIALHERAMDEDPEFDGAQEFAQARHNFWLTTMRIDPLAPVPLDLPPQEKENVEKQRKLTSDALQEKWAAKPLIRRGN